jgi:hypothetical protein
MGAKVRDAWSETHAFFENVRLAWAKPTFGSEGGPKGRPPKKKVFTFEGPRLGETPPFGPLARAGPSGALL